MSDEPEKLAEGTLISHLLELRDRLIKALMGVGLIFLPCMMYANDIFSYVSQPLQEKLPKGASLIATSVMSPFTTPFKLSFFIAAFIAMPWILYQLWAFVAPGLYRNEKRFAVPLLVSAILLFYVGVLFAYFFVFPVMFSFFASTTPKGVSMMTDINSYLDFVLVMFFCVRRRLRSTGRRGAVGDHRDREAGKAAGEPRLRVARHFHFRGDAHTSRRRLTIHPGRADVPPLRRGTAHGAHSPAHEKQRSSAGEISRGRHGAPRRRKDQQ